MTRFTGFLICCHVLAMFGCAYVGGLCAAYGFRLALAINMLGIVVNIGCVMLWLQPATNALPARRVPTLYGMGGRQL